MNIKMTTNSQLSTTEPKKQEKKKKPKQQLEQEQNHKKWSSYGRLSEGRGVMGENIQGVRSIISRYILDRGMLRIG